MEKSKVEKSKEDELCPDEEAISAEEAVKEVVGEARPCRHVDFFSSSLQAPHKTCLERKDTRIWGQLYA